jgi:hypothetical protein
MCFPCQGTFFGMPTLTDSNLPTDRATGWADSGCWGSERTLTRLTQPDHDESDAADLVDAETAVGAAGQDRTTGSRSQTSDDIVREVSRNEARPRTGPVRPSDGGRLRTADGGRSVQLAGARRTPAAASSGP